LPAVVGLLEAALIYGGRAGDVYRLYGDAAGAVTQGYVGLELPGGGHLRRIPSTFSSFYQYYLFLAVMLGVAYAWWRGGGQGRRHGLVAGGTWFVLLAASFLTGVRAAFFMTPLLLALILVLEGRTAIRFAASRLVPVAIVVLAAVTLLPSTHLVGMWSSVFDVARQEFWDVLVDSGREAVELTTFGLGTGIDSIAARYAFANDNDWQQFIFPVLGRWHESWYVKTWLELGVVGVAIVLALFATIIVRGVRAHLTLRDPALRVSSAVCVAIVIWSVVYAIKGQYLDLDPLNVYFWLFAGLMLRLPRLERPEPETEEVAEREQPLAAAI
jgi:O-antigen ligase